MAKTPSVSNPSISFLFGTVVLVCLFELHGKALEREYYKLFTIYVGRSKIKTLSLQSAMISLLPKVCFCLSWSVFKQRN